MKNTEKILEFKTNSKFIEHNSILCWMERCYKKKDYGNALICLNNSLHKVDALSSFALSKFYDLTASLFWKLGEKDKAHSLWQKSCNYDNNNRHSLLSLHLLFKENRELSNLFELFIKIKLNEYYSLKEEQEDNCCLDFFEEDRVLKYLVQFWEQNLSDKHLENMDELEIVDYFINLEIFQTIK